MKRCTYRCTATTVMSEGWTMLLFLLDNKVTLKTDIIECWSFWLLDEDVPWYKPDLHSCFTTRCTNGGSDTRSFKAEDQSHADQWSQCFRPTTRMLPAGTQQSAMVSICSSTLKLFSSGRKSRLMLSAKQKCSDHVTRVVFTRLAFQ